MSYLWNCILWLFGCEQPRIVEFKPSERDEEFKQYIDLCGGSPLRMNMQIALTKFEENQQQSEKLRKVEDSCQFVLTPNEPYEELKKHYTTINCCHNIKEYE